MNRMVLSPISWHKKLTLLTGTPVATNFIYTGSAILTGVAETVIDVDGTGRPRETPCAHTAVAANVVEADATVLAWIGFALINIMFAPQAVKSFSHKKGKLIHKSIHS